ncbi:chitin-binding type-2 domain-containing protein [Caerostris extrusa]|uniref:Chitin-binding type-2 domain-containing protein n=1 Tax=Caerostris extrusa TaxID=172846 RepID=A0AAV4WQI9_CAEEX|nr:chitin-binding type-2 domain-containing protein [Caerostris extrusa]
MGVNDYRESLKLVFKKGSVISWIGQFSWPMIKSRNQHFMTSIVISKKNGIIIFVYNVCGYGLHCTASCPDDGHTFFHADVSSGCTVYHMCENSVLSTFTCLDGQAFDHHTSQCADAATVHCIETGHHHHHKRSTDDMVHSISIEAMKKSTKGRC